MIYINGTKATKNRHGHRLGAFSFCLFLKAQILLLTGFFFSGVELYQRKRERATEGEKQSDRGQRQRGNATPRTAQFFGASRLFLGSVVFSAGWNGSKRTQAIFDGFTAHGLKAANGSRTRRGSTPESQTARNFRPPAPTPTPICEKSVASVGAKSDVAQ